MMTPKYTARTMTPYHEQKWIDSEESQLLEKYEFKFAHTWFEVTINYPRGFPFGQLE